MKKSLVLVLALVFVLGIAGTAFAANPFVDVPAKSWAYDAVAKLAQAGIVDGYGDGTFRGDKTMTRYEMAQIVAKAMAKEDKATADQKAIIDKLAVEFATELNNLGVRVAKLEANQSNIKFTGQLRERFTSDDFQTPGVTSNVQNQYRIRLEAVAKVDDNTSFGMRFVNREPSNSDVANTTWQSFGASGEGGSTPTIDRAYLTTKAGNFAMTLGRQSFYTDYYDILMDRYAFSFDGATVTYGTGNTKLNAIYGRFLKGAGYAMGAADKTIAGGSVKNNLWTNSALNDYFNNLDVMAFTVDSKVGKLSYRAGYYDLRNNDTATVTSAAVIASNGGFSNLSGDKADIKWALANVSYLFTPKFSLGGEYANNNGTKFNTIAGETGTSLYAFNAIVGDQALVKHGDQNLTLFYMHNDANSLINRFSTLSITAGNNAAVNAKTYLVDYNYAFSGAFTGTLEWGKVTSPDGDAVSGVNNTQYRAWLNVKF